MKSFLFLLISLLLTPLVHRTSAPTVITMAGKQPKVLMDVTGAVKLIYGHENTVYYTQAPGSNKPFTKPQAVGSLARGLMLGMGRGPQLATSSNTTVIAAVDKEGNVFSWYAGEKSQNWEGPVQINDADTVAKEGFVALTVGKKDHFYAFWNDLRSGNNQIYGAISVDGGKTWGKNKLLYSSPDTTICECCKVSAASDKAGNVFVMWRNQLNGHRDMYLLTLNDKLEPVSEAAKLGKGTWQLDGCPMDGGNVFADAAGKVITAWMREGNVFISRTGQPEQLISTGRNPAVVLRQNQPLVLWNTREEVYFINGSSDKPVSLGRGSYPQAATEGNTAVACWEGENGQVLYQVLTP